MKKTVSMTIRLHSEEKERIRRFIETSGTYVSVSDFVRAAIRALMEKKRKWKTTKDQV